MRNVGWLNLSGVWAVQPSWLSLHMRLAPQVTIQAQEVEAREPRDRLFETTTWNVSLR